MSSSRSGFTLLEVMIALAIVGIVLVTLLAAGNRAIGVNAHLQQLTRGTLLAQQKMTEIEVRSEAGTLSELEAETAFAPPDEAFRWRAVFSDTPLSSVRMVTVTVWWGDEKKNESVDISSFLLR